MSNESFKSMMDKNMKKERERKKKLAKSLTAYMLKKFPRFLYFIVKLFLLKNINNQHLYTFMGCTPHGSLAGEEKKRESRDLSRVGYHNKDTIALRIHKQW